MSMLFKRIVICIACYCAVFIPLSRYFDHYFGQFIFNDGKEDWIMNRKNEKYDFGVIGSSRVLNMIDIHAMQQELHENGINLGSSGSNFAENYILLKHFLQNGNKLNRLLIQVDIYGLNSSISYSHPVNERYYINMISDPDVTEMYYDYLNPLKVAMWKYVPFARYAEFNQRFRLQDLFHGSSVLHSVLDSAKGTSLLHDSAQKFSEQIGR